MSLPASIEPEPARITPLRRLTRWLGYACGLYLLGLTFYLALVVTIGERFVVVALLNHMLMWLLIAALPATVICLLVFRRRGLITIIPAVVGIAWYAPQFIPKPQSETGISVATYNVTGYLEPVDKIDVIRNLNVDILGLQESAAPGTLYDEMMHIFPYGFVQDQPPDVYEHFGLFSVYPIATDTVEYLDQSPEAMRPAAMRLTVDVDGQPVSVYVMHAVRPNLPIFSVELRHFGMLAVVEALRTDPNPALVLCDCNMTEWTEDYRLLGSVLTDAWREKGVGLGLTVPATQARAPFPLFRGDYIWHSSQFTTQSIEVLGDSGESEHFPVRAYLTLDEAG